MSRTIRIDVEVYEKLQDRATPFQDTPNSVLRRLLDLPVHDVDGAEEPIDNAAPGPRKAQGRPSAPRRGGKRKRAAKGSLLAESEYELPILRIVNGLGGSADAAEVVGELDIALTGKLKDIDREVLASGKVRWESRAQFVRLKLVQKGDLKNDSPRGIWEISDQGTRRLERAK